MASRRVPLDLRKRAALSCDLCKIRRRKCVRSVGSHDCTLCIENGISCTSTIPRKQRSHIPLQELSPRQTIVDQLLARLFPGVATHDLNKLLRLAESLEKENITMSSDDGQLSVLANSTEIFHSATEIGHNTVLSALPESPPTDRILQNSSGTLCYFGPSSSMAFVTQLRERLSSKGLDTLQPKQQRLQKEFAADNRCSTMEDSPTIHTDHSAIRNQLSTSSEQSQRFINALPSKLEVDELVELFFVHVHPNMVLFYRPLFQTALEDIWGSDQIDVGWITCCCVVLAFGCEHKILTSADQTVDHHQPINILQQNLIRLALEMVPQLMLSTTLQSVQAFALLSLYLNATNQRNASWVMAGCSIRMAVSLGMHRGDKAILGRDIRITPIEIELRKRVWWSLYLFEQYNSALFGRPSAVDEVEITTGMPQESVLDEGFYRPPGLLSYDVRLARIVGKIRKSQAERDHGSGAAEQLLNDLHNWDQDLPHVLKYTEESQRHIFPSHFRQLVALQLRYQHSVLLLARPFHLKILQQPEHAMVKKFSTICVGAALESWKLISSLWEHGQFDRNLWLDGVFAYQCGMVLTLACLGTTRKDRKTLESTIEEILNILREISPHRPMNRLVQIADDFSSIVRAMTPPTVPEDLLEPSQSPQTSSVNDDNDLIRQFGMNAGDVNEEISNTDLFYDPHLSLHDQNSTNDSSNFHSAWGFENSGLIDFMLDWNFPQAFGFDSEEAASAQDQDTRYS